MLGVSIPEVAMGHRDLRRMLGSALLGWWDAERADLLTLADGAVSSWADCIGGYAAVQAAAEARPLYAASGFGGRPGVVFDGVNDLLTLEASPFAAMAPMEMWVVASQDAVASDALSRSVVNFGSISGTVRGIYRTVSGGVVRGRATAWGVAMNQESVELMGRHVMRLRLGSSGYEFSVDGSAPVSASMTAGTSSDRMRIGGNVMNTTNTWNGAVNAVLVTTALSSAQASDLLAWGMARAGRG